MVLIIAFFWPMPPPYFKHAKQITATAGAEDHLTLNPSNQQLAFSQYDSSETHRDLLIYSSNNDTLYGLRQSGYDEVSPVWSPDNTQLAYIRQNQFDCQIRILSLNQTPASWRLLPDKSIGNCNVSSLHSPLRWIGEYLYYRNPISQTLMRMPIPRKNQSLKPADKSWSNVLAFDIADQHLLILKKQQNLLFIQYQNTATGESLDLGQIAPPVTSIKWKEPGRSFWIAGNAAIEIQLDGARNNESSAAGFIYDLTLQTTEESEFMYLAAGQMQANLFEIHFDQTSAERGALPHAISDSPNFDYLPTFSPDGKQIGYISQYFDPVDNSTYQGLWVKHADKASADLILNLPESLQPQLLLWSPQSDFILLQDARFRFYLINVFSGDISPVLDDHQHVIDVHWRQPKELIFSKASDASNYWALDLVSNQLSKVNTEYQPSLASYNSSFSLFQDKVLKRIQAALPDYPLEELQHAIQLVTPHLTDKGFYWILPGLNHSELLYLDFATNHLDAVAQINRPLVHFGLPLNLSADPVNQRLILPLLGRKRNNIMQRVKVNR